jgi:soluble lytic murein transglycosylase
MAGLGLDVEAREAAADPEHESAIALYNRLRLHKEWIDLPRLQWTATEVLESDAPSDPRVAGYLLELAYPTPHLEEVDKAATATGVDAALIYAVMKKESNFKPAAVSAVGATGLMQLMPGTAGMMARATGVPAEPLTDAAVNIRLGAEYIASLQRDIAAKAAKPGPQEDEHDALTRAVLHCYNAGPGNYAKWRKLYPTADATLLTDLIPNEENEEFGKRVFKYYQIYRWRLEKE